MKSSRVSARRYAWAHAGLALMIVVAAGSALAQAPRSLLPTKPLELRPFPDPQGQSRPLLPANPLPANPLPAPAQPGAAGDATTGPMTTDSKSGIEINRLRTIAIDSVGTLDRLSGGFAPDMWRDTPRPVIERLIGLLPAATPSRTLRDLRRRLLLTAATVPPATGAATGAATESSSQPTGGLTGPAARGTLLLARASALFLAGDLPAVSQLLAVVPASHQEEALAKLASDAAFLVNDLARACDITATWVGRSQKRYWQKALVFCEALNGAWEQVDFGMRLLIELGEGDETFFALMRGIGGEANSGSGLDPSRLRPLDVAMLRGARAGLPEPNPTTPAPWLLRSYMDDPKVSLRSRIALAEQAERFGIAESSELARLYDAMQVSPELLESAVSVASADPGPKGRALLYRATQAQVSAFGQAQAIKQAQVVATGRGLYQQMARLYAPIMRSIRIGSEFGWFAADAALLQTADGDLAAARPWLALAEREAEFDPEARDGWRRIWPLIRLMAGDALVEWRADRLRDWWTWIRVAEPENANRKAVLLFGLLAALEDPVPPAIWRGLVDRPAIQQLSDPGLAMTRALADATEAERVGEAIALILIATGEERLESISPAGLVTAVGSLKTMGLDVEARRLAFEIITAIGL
jgi:hypothetical protein